MDGCWILATPRENLANWLRLMLPRMGWRFEAIRTMRAHMTLVGYRAERPWEVKRGYAEGAACQAQ